MGTLWHGGTIYTLRSERDIVEALFVKDGIIHDIGEVGQLRSKHSGSIDNEIDLKGGYMFPGFVDSHLHMIGHGEKLIRLDLSELTSAEEMKKVLLSAVEQSNEGEWIIGEGWNENNFSDRKIFHRTELDEIAPNHPLLLTRVCRHALLANSRSLQLANITDATIDPPGGVIVRDDQGVPTGYLLDQAQELVKSVVPEVSESYLEKALTTTVDDMYRLGLVGGHTEDLNYYGGFKRTFDTFTKVIDGSKRKFRTNLLVHHEVVEDMHQLGYIHGDYNPYIEFGAMKIFADGALGGRTALLSSPYNDAPETSGVAIYSLDELKILVKKARSYKMPVAVHAIGDLALEYVIDAIETYPVLAGQRDRIIHAQVVREDLIERLKKLSVVLDIQPRFVAADFPWVEERLGFERLPYSFAWRTLLQNDLLCAGGSDAPIEPVDPLLGIHAAVTRKKPGEDHDGYLPEQKLTIYEAVKLFTVGSALAIGKEDSRGLIEKGSVADFTVFDKDLFTIDPDDLLQTKVLKTVVDNTIMYE